MRPLTLPRTLPLLVLLVLLAPNSRATAQTRPPSASFTVGGQVTTPRSYTLADLRALPSEERAVEFTAGGQPQRHSYTGVRLLTLLTTAAPRFNPAQNNDALGWYVSVTGSDGYVVTLSWGEIAPDFANQPVLVAYLEDGQPLVASDGMARLVVPGDSRGGRYVSAITSMRVQRAEPEPAPLVVYHAGSLTTVMTRDIEPAFTAAAGYPVTDTGGPSVGLANMIRSGAIHPDVYMTADAINIPELLIGAQNGDLARWYFVMARQQMVLAYAPTSRFAADFAAVNAGAKTWYELLQTPGLVLKRGDPRTDPGGYRGYFLFLLAEHFYGIPGLADRLTGGADNPAQIEDATIDKLQDGSADALVTYLTNAVDAGVPYVTLADELNQSNPALEALYRTATYTNPLGQRFSGSALVYGVTIPEAATNKPGAVAFVQFLLSEQGRAALAARGFLPADVLVGGDEDAVPAALRGLIQGRYGP